MAIPSGNTVASSYVDVLRSVSNRVPSNQMTVNETATGKPDPSPLSASAPQAPIAVVDQIPQLFALIIGINKYKSSGVKTLKGAIADANEVQLYLERQLNVPSSQIRNLHDVEATRAAIIGAFYDLRNDSRIQNGDPILIYFAGHGGECDAPIGWEAGGSKIQMLVPYDFGTKINNCDVPGIPDRTVAVLLDRLAKEKGDNITVIFDCCHSSSGTRKDRIHPTRLPRAIDVPCNIPADIDQDIWHDSDSHRGMTIAPGFLQSGLTSHVLLAACGAEECAMEEMGRGVFTKAFLEVLTTIGADKITYSDLLGRIHALPEQNPQCEGYNQNRLLFNSRAPSRGRVLYAVIRNNNKYVMNAGAAHGITDGAEFVVYQDRDLRQTTFPLGTLVVLEARAFYTTLDVPLGDARFDLVHPGFALQTKTGTEEDLRLHTATNEAIIGVFQAIVQEMQYTGSEFRRILLVEKDKAELDISLEDGCVVFKPLNTLVTQWGLTRIPFRVSASIAEVNTIILASAHYFWHLRRTNTKRSLQNRVRIEFTRLKELDDEFDDDFNPLITPDGPNLNINGTVDLIVDHNAMYGVKIVNDTDLALYPSLFFFDNSDLSIKSYYQPPTAGMFKVDPPIGPKGSLTIGYGSGGSSPFNYLLRDGQDIDVGFLKLFLSTAPVDFSNIPQRSPFYVDPRKGRLAQVKTMSVWNTLLVTVVQRRWPDTSGYELPIF